MKQLLLIVTFQMLVIAAIAQTTGSARVSATIYSPDEICALSLNSSDGSQFILKNGNHNCFDISIAKQEFPLTEENILQNPGSIKQYTLCQSSVPNTNDLLINITSENQSAQKNETLLKRFTISVHYN